MIMNDEKNEDFTSKEFSFLLELKEHCLLGRFVPTHIT